MANRQFSRLYKQLSGYVNVSYNTLHIHLKNFSVTDDNQQRLVRSKMLIIFKPRVRCLLSTTAAGFHHGSLGGLDTVVKQLEEYEKVSSLLKSYLLYTCKYGKGKDKPGGKGAKKAAAGGSRAKERKIPSKSPKKEPRSLSQLQR